MQIYHDMLYDGYNKILRLRYKIYVTTIIKKNLYYDHVVLLNVIYEIEAVQ